MMASQPPADEGRAPEPAASEPVSPPADIASPATPPTAAPALEVPRVGSPPSNRGLLILTFVLAGILLVGVGFVLGRVVGHRGGDRFGRGHLWGGSMRPGERDGGPGMGGGFGPGMGGGFGPGTGIPGSVPTQAPSGGSGGGTTTSPGVGTVPGVGFTGQRLAIGTVSHVDGSTLYVTTRSGAKVKVSTDGSTLVRIVRTGTLKDLREGTTVAIQGADDGRGSVKAARIVAGTFSSGGSFPIG
jgi:hypothetical protein